MLENWESQVSISRSLTTLRGIFCRGVFLEGIDDRAHPAGVRSLDDHHVAALHRRHDDRCKVACAVAPAPLYMTGQSLEQMFHQGTGREDEIDAISDGIAGELGGHRRAFISKFQPVAEGREAGGIARQA